MCFPSLLALGESVLEVSVAENCFIVINQNGRARKDLQVLCLLLHINHLGTKA